jgi:hypothetical protein
VGREKRRGVEEEKRRRTTGLRPVFGALPEVPAGRVVHRVHRVHPVHFGGFAERNQRRARQQARDGGPRATRATGSKPVRNREVSEQGDVPRERHRSAAKGG